ncbi:Uncharacterised protein [Bordetella pertussis]|nr:Uncharacterised protein [Bordetella pertussis]CFV98519.1 Uncharacterised protein [Bordetella pertussis]CFW37937.1 Uncharacterised protein [Bordetella pertussis]
MSRRPARPAGGRRSSIRRLTRATAAAWSATPLLRHSRGLRRYSLSSSVSRLARLSRISSVTVRLKSVCMNWSADIDSPRGPPLPPGAMQPASSTLAAHPDSAASRLLVMPYPSVSLVLRRPGRAWHDFTVCGRKNGARGRRSCVRNRKPYSACGSDWAAGSAVPDCCCSMPPIALIDRRRRPLSSASMTLTRTGWPTFSTSLMLAMR